MRRPAAIRLMALALVLTVMLAPPVRAGAAPTVSLAIVGDVMLADGPGRVIARGRDPLGPSARCRRVPTSA